MQACGLSYAPADAPPLVKKVADYVTAADGGKGVAREVAEHILLLGGLDIENAYTALTQEWTYANVQQ